MGLVAFYAGLIIGFLMGLLTLSLFYQVFGKKSLPPPEIGETKY